MALWKPVLRSGMPAQMAVCIRGSLLRLYSLFGGLGEKTERERAMVRHERPYDPRKGILRGAG